MVSCMSCPRAKQLTLYADDVRRLESCLSARCTFTSVLIQAEQNLTRTAEKYRDDMAPPRNFRGFHLVLGDTYKSTPENEKVVNDKVVPGTPSPPIGALVVNGGPGSRANPPSFGWQDLGAVVDI